jgi:DNA-binding MarR family transcriptional regulator
VGKLLEELKQRKPFQNLREEAILNVWRTSDFLAYRLQMLLKTRSISQTQYNVLRILRGAGDNGIPFGEIAERMLTRDPDITRLMDRLVRRGFARRTRLGHDRRVILARITPSGTKLLAELDLPITQLEDETIGHMKSSQLKTLIALLEEARNKDR